jgi:nitroreductase
MEFQQVVQRRRMVRRFTGDPVAQDSIERMVRNAVRAPNAGFSQGWAFLVLDQPDQVAQFWEATTPPSKAVEPDSWLRGMRTAPVIIVPLSSKAAYLERYAEPDKGWTDKDDARWAMPYWHIDTGMAALLILQTAVDEGLGACFFGVPPQRTDALRTAFGVPAEYTPIGAIAIGHPAPTKGPRGSVTKRERKPLQDVVHYGHWS